MNYEKYITDCKEMAEKKRNDKELEKVYSDINFEQLAFEAQEYVDYLEYTNSLFAE